MPRKHTQGFKEQAVQKSFINDGKSIKTIAQELNIGYSTLQKWIREYKSMTGNNDSQRPQDWSRKQQFHVLMETASMNEDQCSQYCREKGLFPHHLNTWRDSFIESDKKTASSIKSKADIADLKKQNARLQKDLRRKEKALAETAALLVLQKKFQALLEERDE